MTKTLKPSCLSSEQFTLTDARIEDFCRNRFANGRTDECVSKFLIRFPLNFPMISCRKQKQTPHSTHLEVSAVSVGAGSSILGLVNGLGSNYFFIGMEFGKITYY